MRAIVESKTMDVLTIVMIKIHLIRKPAKGGNPPRLAISISNIHFITFLLVSVFNVFILKLLMRYIIMMTEAQ